MQFIRKLKFYFLKEKRERINKKKRTHTQQKPEMKEIKP